MPPFIQQKLKLWLDKRIPPSASVTLDQRRIFIFPSRYGFLYLVLSMGILVGATNYEKICSTLWSSGCSACSS